MKELATSGLIPSADRQNINGNRTLLEKTKRPKNVDFFAAPSFALPDELIDIFCT